MRGNSGSSSVKASRLTCQDDSMLFTQATNHKKSPKKRTSSFHVQSNKSRMSTTTTTSQQSSYSAVCDQQSYSAACGALPAVKPLESSFRPLQLFQRDSVPVTVPHRQLCTAVTGLDHTGLRDHTARQQGVNNTVLDQQVVQNASRSARRKDINMYSKQEMSAGTQYMKQYETTQRDSDVTNSSTVAGVMSDDDYCSPDSAYHSSYGSGSGLSNVTSLSEFDGRRQWSSPGMRGPPYNKLHEKYPSWPVTQAVTVLPTGISSRTSSWSDNREITTSGGYLQARNNAVSGTSGSGTFATSGTSGTEDRLAGTDDRPVSPRSARRYFEQVTSRNNNFQSPTQQQQQQQQRDVNTNYIQPYRQQQQEQQEHVISNSRGMSFRQVPPVFPDSSPPPPLPDTSPPHESSPLYRRQSSIDQRNHSRYPDTTRCMESAGTPAVRNCAYYNTTTQTDQWSVEPSAGVEVLCPTPRVTLQSPATNTAPYTTQLSDILAVQPPPVNRQVSLSPRNITQNAFFPQGPGSHLSGDVVSNDVIEQLKGLPASQTSMIRRLSQEFYGQKTRLGARLSLANTNGEVSRSMRGHDVGQVKGRDPVVESMTSPDCVEDETSKFNRTQRYQMSLRKAFGVFDEYQYEPTDDKMPSVAEDDISTETSQPMDGRHRRHSESRHRERSNKEHRDKEHRSMSTSEPPVTAVAPAAADAGNSSRTAVRHSYASSQSSTSGSSSSYGRQSLDLPVPTVDSPSDVYIDENRLRLKMKSRSLPANVMLPASLSAASYTDDVQENVISSSNQRFNQLGVTTTDDRTPGPYSPPPPALPPRRYRGEQDSYHGDQISRHGNKASSSANFDELKVEDGILADSYALQLRTQAKRYQQTRTASFIAPSHSSTARHAVPQTVPVSSLVGSQTVPVGSPVGSQTAPVGSQQHQPDWDRDNWLDKDRDTGWNRDRQELEWQGGDGPSWSKWQSPAWGQQDMESSPDRSIAESWSEGLHRAGLHTSTGQQMSSMSPGVQTPSMSTAESVPAVNKYSGRSDVSRRASEAVLPPRPSKIVLPSRDTGLPLDEPVLPRRSSEACANSRRLSASALSLRQPVATATSCQGDELIVSSRSQLTLIQPSLNTKRLNNVRVYNDNNSVTTTTTPPHFHHKTSSDSSVGSSSPREVQRYDKRNSLTACYSQDTTTQPAGTQYSTHSGFKPGTQSAQDSSTVQLATQYVTASSDHSVNNTAIVCPTVRSNCTASLQQVTAYKDTSTQDTSQDMSTQVTSTQDTSQDMSTQVTSTQDTSREASYRDTSQQHITEMKSPRDTTDTSQEEASVKCTSPRGSTLSDSVMKPVVTSDAVIFQPRYFERVKSSDELEYSCSADGIVRYLRGVSKVDALSDALLLPSERQTPSRYMYMALGVTTGGVTDSCQLDTVSVLLQQRLAIRQDKRCSTHRQHTTVETVNNKIKFIDVVEQTLNSLKIEKKLLEDEIVENDKLGSEVKLLADSKLLPRERDKYKSYLRDVAMATSLLLRLSDMLCRAENALLCLPQNASDKQKASLLCKRDELLSKHDDARLLRCDIETRSRPIVTALHQQLSTVQFVDHTLYHLLNTQLAVELQDVEHNIQFLDKQLHLIQYPQSSSSDC